MILLRIPAYMNDHRKLIWRSMCKIPCEFHFSLIACSQKKYEGIVMRYPCESHCSLWENFPLRYNSTASLCERLKSATLYLEFHQRGSWDVLAAHTALASLPKLYIFLRPGPLNSAPYRWSRRRRLLGDSKFQNCSLRRTVTSSNAGIQYPKGTPQWHFRMCCPPSRHASRPFFPTSSTSCLV